MTHIRVWKFRPAQHRESEFAEAYGKVGLWAELFGRAHGYIGTELLKPCEPGGWWLTIDRWHSQADFESFQREFGIEYRGLDNELEGLAGEEEFVGAFEA